MISVVICADALSIESVYFELSTYQLFLVLTFDKNLSSVVQNQERLKIIIRTLKFKCQ